MSNIALLIVFNHRFDINIPVLREHYKDRFSNIYFLVPFYDGNDRDVIPVYYPSNNFQGYFSQAYQHLKNNSFDYWFVAADDMIINPELNETNIFTSLKITNNDSFIPKLNKFTEKVNWPHSSSALSFTFNNRFVEIKEQLPTYEDAYIKLKQLSVEPEGLKFNKVYKELETSTAASIYGKRYLQDIKSQSSLLNAEFPFCWGYSDIFCIGSENIKYFSHLCGVFASAGLFVEIAIPTAIALSTQGKVITNSEVEYRGRHLIQNERTSELEKYNFNLNELIKNFPSDYLFLHPIKLSQWNV